MAPSGLVEGDAPVSDRNGRAGAAGHLLIDDCDGVRRVTFDRPDKLNAMTDAMFDELTDTLVEASLEVPAPLAGETMIWLACSTWMEWSWLAIVCA